MNRRKRRRSGKIVVRRNRIPRDGRMEDHRYSSQEDTISPSRSAGAAISLLSILPSWPIPPVFHWRGFRSGNRVDTASLDGPPQSRKGAEFGTWKRVNTTR